VPGQERRSGSLGGHPLSKDRRAQGLRPPEPAGQPQADGQFRSRQQAVRVLTELIFAIAARDELWAGGRRLESRLTHGIARQDGNEITATDDADPALLAACEQAMARAHELAHTTNDRGRVTATHANRQKTVSAHE